MSDLEKAITLKEWANIALAKHTKKILKCEAGVIADKDPEDLHQMRVGMRRLRSAIAGFAVALDLPPTVTEKKIAKIGRSLGKLRDLDVLLASLQDDYRSQLPKSEQKILDKAIKSLNKKRQNELQQVRETLDSKLYLNLKQGLQDWLENPQYQAIGDFSIYNILPDLLLPQVSQFLLHPGWLVGIELEAGEVKFLEKIDRNAVEQLLDAQESILHDLRKAAKKVRYNLELFADFYGDNYRAYLKQIEQIQEVLGQIQDCHVLRNILEKVSKSSLAETIPELANILTETRYQKWQEWSILQKQCLENNTRTEIRKTIQQSIEENKPN
jgi:CHAD domain-containing protein